LYNLTKKLENNKAEAKTIIGYAKNPKKIYFFEGSVKGNIVSPKGTDFGWGPIFKPEGYSKTYGEMTKLEKSEISMRSIALKKFKLFLKENKK